MIENRTTQIAIGVAALTAVIALALLWSREKPADPVRAASAAVPLVMHTSGGRLEVATVRAVEAFKLAEQTAVVEAGEIQPQLPVAFDTRTMEKYTASGWARFNKNDNLERLERSLSPLLEARAHGHKKLAIESARKSVSDFVTTWLLKYHPLERGTVPRVEVVFPGEVSSAQRASGPNGVQP